ncbi:MAG: AraC family transcriptional regulator [Lachnospiraceae bacterium]|nr:AraC family transcriptional regulator [Lachnospiraceae bacterium]
MKSSHDIFIHESGLSRNPIEQEVAIYDAVSSGNMDDVISYCNKNKFTNTEGLGVLSDNEIRNMRYHFVIGTAMITRYCVGRGLEQDKAYSMSDYYIYKMDSVKTIEEINRIHSAMCLDFCETMISLKNRNVISRSIKETLEYISANIYRPILLSDLAEHVNLSESYLSKLFAKEMGVSIREYINLTKIEKARNLLCYSEYSFIDIANYLAFSSQSHFISIFKKYEGMTPKKYRDTHFHSTWSLSK